MSPTRDCFLVTHDFLATALEVQTDYPGLLDEWEAWLASGSCPSNAEQLQLWQLINVTYEPASKARLWSQWPRDGAEMNAVINWGKSDALRDQMGPRPPLLDPSPSEQDAIRTRVGGRPHG